MTEIVDRRLNGKDKSIGNRERFKRRVAPQIKERIQRKLGADTLEEIKKQDKHDISVPKRDIQEPVFGHASGGNREYVHPGNKEFIKGDRIERPKGGGGGGGGTQASDTGEGEDDFVFTLTREEFLEYLFDDMELMNLLRNNSDSVTEFVPKRAGFSADGSPNNLHVVRSLRQSFMRKMPLEAAIRNKASLLETAKTLLLWPREGMGEPEYKTLLALFDEKQALVQPGQDSFGALMTRVSDNLALRAKSENRAWDGNLLEPLLTDIDQEIERQKNRKILYLDPIDLRYRNSVQHPVPISSAKGYLLADDSGSMDENRKYLAKVFCLFAILFIEKNYEKVELFYFRHNTVAVECDEKSFFNDKTTGGTTVSSGLRLVCDTMKSRHPSPTENLYLIQLSDGDNFDSDTPLACQIMREEILPLVRHVCYIQVAENEQSLWHGYKKIQSDHPHKFAIEKVLQENEAYQALKRIFRKRDASHRLAMTMAP